MNKVFLDQQAQLENLDKWDQQDQLDKLEHEEIEDLKYNNQSKCMYPIMKCRDLLARMEMVEHKVLQGLV